MKRLFSIYCFICSVSVCSCNSGLSFSIHTSLQNQFLNGEPSEILNLVRGKEERSKPKAFTFKFDDIKNNGPFTFKYSEDFATSDVYSINTVSKKADIINVKIATTYFYKIYENDIELKSDKFFVNDEVIRNIDIDGVTNARDLGGHKLNNGKRSKQGLIYRTSRLDMLDTHDVVVPAVTEDGIKTCLNDLKIKTEIDLRNYSEVGSRRKKSGSILGPTVNYFLEPMYQNVSSPIEYNKEKIKETFELLADKNNYPVILHCKIGTDRTGLISYLFNGLLGVSEKNLQYDYLFSNFGLIDESGAGRSLEFMNYCFGNYIKSQQGNSISEKVENYLLNIGVKKSSIDSIKEIMI